MIKTGVSCCIIITCARGGYPPLQGGYFGFGRANIVKYRKGVLLLDRVKRQFILRFASHYLVQTDNILVLFPIIPTASMQ